MGGALYKTFIKQFKKDYSHLWEDKFETLLGKITGFRCPGALVICLLSPLYFPDSVQTHLMSQLRMPNSVTLKIGSGAGK